MHYTRIPRAYWRDRFRMARAMGLNTITTYVFWNVHEPRPGVFDFSGQNDVAEYIREAQEEGLHVILRPGPYVCAEWDLGGFPSWLLKDRSLVLRSQDPKYLAAVEQWFTRLGKEIHPLLLQNGGPIIAIQVENEYGSFGNDHAYMEAVKDMLVRSGMDAPVLYTADGPEEIPNGSLPELPAVINFGAGDAEKSFAILHRIRPNGPSMSGEYWAGWFDHWGEPHHVTDGKREAAELEWMLKQGYSVSLYMFHGGTSFRLDEWRQQQRPAITSPTPPATTTTRHSMSTALRAPKFFLFRDAIARATGKHRRRFRRQFPRAVSPCLRIVGIGVSVEQSARAGGLRQTSHHGRSGPVLRIHPVSNQARARESGELAIDGLHDYAQVYIDRKLVGALDRRLDTSRLTLPPIAMIRPWTSWWRIPAA